MLPQSDWGREMPVFLALPGLLEPWPLLKLPLEPNSPFLCHPGHGRAFVPGKHRPQDLQTQAQAQVPCGVFDKPLMHRAAMSGDPQALGSSVSLISSQPRPCLTLLQTWQLSNKQ